MPDSDEPVDTHSSAQKIVPVTGWGMFLMVLGGSLLAWLIVDFGKQLAQSWWVS